MKRRPSRLLPIVNIPVHDPSFKPAAGNDPDCLEVAQATREFFSEKFVQKVMEGVRAQKPFVKLRIEYMLISLLFLVAEGEPSLNALYERIVTGELWNVPAIDVARKCFYERLKDIQQNIFLEVLREVCREIRKRGHVGSQAIRDLAPFATMIVAIDDTTLDALVRKTKILKQYKKGAMATLGGRLGLAIDVATGLIAEAVHDSNSKANEKTHLMALVNGLPKGCLLLLDSGYFAFHRLDTIGAEHFFIIPLRAKTSFVVVRKLHDSPWYRDRIIYLGKHRSDRGASPVRLVELLVDGQWWSYLTNVLDPVKLNATAVWGAYSHRWHIEKVFHTIKRCLRLAFIHPCKRNGILLQLWATLMVYMILQDLRVRLAQTMGWTPDDISVPKLMRFIAIYSERPRDQSLQDWLSRKPVINALKKQGRRKRRLDELPKEVTDEIARLEPMNGEIKVKKRKPHQSRQYLPKSPGVVVRARLG